jgi:hypothetical protein
LIQISSALSSPKPPTRTDRHVEERPAPGASAELAAIIAAMPAKTSRMPPADSSFRTARSAVSGPMSSLIAMPGLSPVVWRRV